MDTLNPKPLQNQYQNPNQTFTQANRRPPKPKPQNPIETAISTWFQALPTSLIHELNNNNNTFTSTTAQLRDLSKEDDLFRDLIATAPKRWVVYPPMVLLPSGSFCSSFDFGSNDNSSEKVWEGVFEVLRKERRQDEDGEERLWRGILHEISMREGKGKGRLTHLAVNAGIPLNQTLAKEKGEEGRNGEGNEKEKEREENILRSPSGLIMLYGDFGPALSPGYVPSEKDFEDAFWVSTRQNGIFQSWAPRYTMFSRGNVKEKARLLGFHSSSFSSSSLESSGGNADGSNVFKERARSRGDLENQTAVDLYAGIGYFVFSYVKMGMGKVVGWELNPWSVEGLRRGAVGNGWSVRVVKDGEEGALERILDGGEEIVVFLEDNREAGGRLRDWKRKGDVLHVNCGLLPTSEMSWEMGLGMVGNEGWLHLHENVGVADIERRKRDIEKLFRGWLKRGNDDRDAILDHVELVKTFAPGVWHCVFDVHICRKSSGS